MTRVLIALLLVAVVLAAGCAPWPEPQDFRAVSDGRLVSGWPCVNGYVGDGTVWVSPAQGADRRVVLCRPCD